MDYWLALLAIAWTLGVPIVALVLAWFAYQRTLRLEEYIRGRSASLSTNPPPLPTPKPEPKEKPQPGRGAQPATVPASRSPSEPETKPEPRPAPRTSPGWEERIGARLPVWLGGAALALAGIFLVHYSIENNWIGPAARVVLGALAGLACCILGEVFSGRSYRIGAALSAAGIAAIYAAFVASVTLYHLASPLAGFFLVALTTIAAVLLSLRRGSIVAIIGLMGGFVTPALVGAGDERPYLLFGFFLILQIATGFVVRKRDWWPLAFLASLGAFAWSAVWLLRPDHLAHTALIGAFLLTSCALIALNALARAGSDTRSPHGPIRASLAFLHALLTIVLVTLTVPAGAFGLLEWSYLGLLGVGVVALARLDDRFVALPGLAAAATLGMLAVRGWTSSAGSGAPGIEPLILVFGALYTLAPYLAHWRARSSAILAWTAALSLLGYFGLSWHLLASRHPELSFGALALGLAVMPIAAALPYLRDRGRDGAAEGALAAFLVAATALVALAVPLELERAWIAVAWSIQAALLAWLAGWLRVPILRVLSASLAAITVARLVLNPALFTYPTGEHPLIHWIHYGYGIPILALALSAWFYVRQRQEALAIAHEVGAMLLAMPYVGLAIRQGFSPGRLLGPLSSFHELAAYGAGWMLLATLLLLVAPRVQRPTLLVGGRVIACFALAYVILVPGLVLNPIWSGLSVGSLPVLNSLALAFGLPVLLLLLLRRSLSANRSEAGLLVGSAGAWLLFVWTTLEVRHLFRGAHLSAGTMSDAELYAYSAAWVLLGTALLALGIWRRSTFLRAASLAAMLAAVAKVFLYDFSGLDGLYRVFSFFGLGVSLLLLAFLYQRFVFREAQPRSAPTAPS